MRLPLPGRFNVANALAAAGARWARASAWPTWPRALRSPCLPPGRFEMVKAGQPFNVVVDYAHTPDALERLMEAAREVTPGRVITVFGCGGDRDKGKRPLMGKLAAAHSDLTVVTSDNPRTEKAEAILDDIFAGIPKAARSHTLRVADRRQAIALGPAPGPARRQRAHRRQGPRGLPDRGQRQAAFDDREAGPGRAQAPGLAGRKAGALMLPFSPLRLAHGLRRRVLPRGAPALQRRRARTAAGLGSRRGLLRASR